MKLNDLEKLAVELHHKANASTGIPAAEDKNEWMAERIDALIEEGSYALADLLEESETPEQAIQYLQEQYEHLNNPDHRKFNE